MPLKAPQFTPLSMDVRIAQLKGSHGRQKARSTGAPRAASTAKAVETRKPTVKVADRELNDPRFQASVATHEKATAQRNYAFVTDMRRRELTEMQTQLAELYDGEPRDFEAIARLKERIAAHRQILGEVNANHRKQDVRRQLKRAEADAVRQGKRPHYLKEKEMRNAMKVSKFLDTTKKGGKALEKVVLKERKTKALRSQRR